MRAAKSLLRQPVLRAASSSLFASVTAPVARMSSSASLLGKSLLGARVATAAAVPRTAVSAASTATGASAVAVTSVPKRGALFTKSVATPEAQKAVGLPPVGAAAALKASNADWELVYEGNIAKPLTQLKMLSAGSLFLALLSAPVIVTFDTDAIDATGRALLAAVTLTMGVGTTIMTNFIATPYVCRLFVSTKDPYIVELVTASFTGQMQSFRMNVTERLNYELLRPLVTFQHAASKRYFYVQEEFCTHPVFGPLLPHLFEEVPADAAAASASAALTAAAAATTADDPIAAATAGASGPVNAAPVSAAAAPAATAAAEAAPAAAAEIQQKQ